MKRSDDTQAIEQILCPQCIDAYAGLLAKEETSEKTFDGKQANDIYQMERKSQELEVRILTSLPPARKDELRIWVASVLELAERRSERAVSNCAEQGMLFNILMAEAWKAAQSYDPSKSKFSTWVYRPWHHAMQEFRRVKRLPTQSLSAPFRAADTDMPPSLEDELEDTNSPSPSDCVESQEWTQHTKAIFDSQPLTRTMIEDACQQFEWLCPFCRRVLRDYFLSHTPEIEDVALPQRSAQNVYARRAFWLAF